MQFGELRDGFGRVARDLRVSLTDRCNLRCSYCMPPEGMEWLPNEQVLSDAEVERTLRVAVERLGVRRIRFTGGEPLLRPGLVGIVAAAGRLRGDEGRPELALTTNGLGLDKKIEPLIEAGLDRINVSLDSLDPARYAQLTLRDRLGDVLASLEAVDRHDFGPVKINAVVRRGVNEVDVVPLAEFCLSRGYQLRFIEQMPLGPAHEWARSAMVTADEILGSLQERFELTPAEEPRGAAPAQLWRVAADGDLPGGTIGVIASVTRPFCGDCDRTRITADGQVRACLFSRRETDLRAILRGGASDEELAEAWLGAHRAKPKAHGIDDQGFQPPRRTMSAIGG